MAAIAALAATAAVRASDVGPPPDSVPFLEVLAAGPVSLGWTTLFFGPT